MRKKVQFLAVFWTLFLAIPFTALALSGLAFATENTYEINEAIRSLSESASVGGRGLLLEISERWPEVAGMVVGQLVIMIILIFAHREKAAESQEQ